MDRNRAFTLVELLITVAIMLVIAVVLFVNYSPKRATTEMASTDQQIETLVREAQSRMLAGDQNGTSGNGVWGVKFANSTQQNAPFYGLFYANSSATTSLTAASVVSRYQLPGDISYTTSTVAATGTLYLYFSPGTSGAAPSIGAVCQGYTCPGGTTTVMIGLYTPTLKTQITSTVSIFPSGQVTY